MAPSALSPNSSTTTTTYSYGSLHRPTKKMSITQTFYLAHKARGKLSSEATRSDHNLRLLVGHANLLDSLMIHLAHAEAEQERWYYNTVRGNEESWQETESEDYGSLAADYESETESESDSDFDSEESEDEEEVRYLPRTQPTTTFKARAQEVVVGVHEIKEDELELDDDEEVEDEEFDEDGMFTLTRTTSHRPPSLCSDLSDEEDEEEDEESTPPSSPESRLPVSEKEFHDVSRSYFDSQLSSIHDHDQSMLFEERMGLSTMIAPVY